MFYGVCVSGPVAHLHQQASLSSGLHPPVTVVGSIDPQHLPQQQQTFADGLKCLKISESTKARKPEVQQTMGIPHSDSFILSMQPGISKIESAVSSGVNTDCLVGNASATFPPTSRSPVSRPVRQLGPPPGFSRVAPKQVNEPISGSDMTCENPLMDDYSWLDGYQFPASLKGSGLCNSIDK